jgi:hypothetical protein
MGSCASKKQKKLTPEFIPDTCRAKFLENEKLKHLIIANNIYSLPTLKIEESDLYKRRLNQLTL